MTKWDERFIQLAEKFRHRVVSEETKQKIAESIRKWHEERKNKLREVG